MKYGDKCKLKSTVSFPDDEKRFIRVPVGTIVTYLSKAKEIDGVDMACIHLDKDERVELVAKTLLEPFEEKPSKPTHYDTGIDTIAFLRANCPPEQVEGFLRGNALKYLQRYDKKNGVDDLRKAKHYVEMLIEELEGRE